MPSNNLALDGLNTPPNHIGGLENLDQEYDYNIDNIEGDLPEDLQNNGEHYGLKVKGDSMVEAGINDGDTVIVKKTSNVDSGQIAVVLIDDQEATLKRIRKKGNTIALEAANQNYETKIYASNRIKIQGKLISLYRNFH